jgi:possible membrane protein involved in D-alanine export
MLRGRIRKEKKGKREEEGFYGMEEEADMEEIKDRGAIDVGTIDIGTIVEDTIDEDAIDEDARHKFGVETEEDIKEDIEEAMQKESGLSEEELKRHSIALKKIQRKTKWTIFFLDHGEKMYYFLKILLALLALCISFAAMAGQSYTPFLYNQF